MTFIRWKVLYGRGSEQAVYYRSDEDGNYFYIVIDAGRTVNVYFLNMVDEAICTLCLPMG
jgi:hypothetical protein